MKIVATANRVVDLSVKVRVKIDPPDVDVANGSMSAFAKIVVEEIVRLG